MDKFHFRSATSDDIDGLMMLETDIERSLPARDMFATDTREFYEPIIAGKGNILLVLDEGDTIAGASVIYHPDADDDDNLGRALDLDRDSCARVRHLDAVFIRPDCQGQHLAEHLIRENLRHTQKYAHPLDMATIHPRNLASLKLHLKLGLCIHGFAFKYGGKPRFILLKDEECSFIEKSAVSVPMDDLRTQQDLLKNGFIGVGTEIYPDDKNSFSIKYCRRAALRHP